jgi:hypothetical protein
VQQGAAKCGKEQHKAKVRNRLILLAATHDPARPNKGQQRTANVIFSAC